LTYLTQTIEETLRFYDPVPALGRRAVNKDSHLGKLFIPKGTSLFVPSIVHNSFLVCCVVVGIFVVLNIFGIHRSESYWTDPLSFAPERFAVMIITLTLRLLSMSYPTALFSFIESKRIFNLIRCIINRIINITIGKW
jgi:cytochrome P450